MESSKFHLGKCIADRGMDMASIPAWLYISQAVNKLQRRIVEKTVYDHEVTDFILSGECVLLLGREVQFRLQS